NTYASPEVLRRLFDDALAWPGVVGLAVATRPDCLPTEILDLLSEYNRRTFLWVELGLQTIHDPIAEKMNRCYPRSIFDQAMADLKQRNILTVVHLILGLPEETKEMMAQSVQYVSDLHPFGIKLHLLHVLKNTGLARLYPQGIHTFTQQEYIEFVVDLLERMPQDITIHRLTGDGPADDLISPLWSIKKRDILNGIQKEFKRRDSWQGKLL
ncbi:MAG: TIGR01212 family radical SAM protein, partial [Firmicutes bacterium]|nr:TIGR01212 family radical SAM protein [Bacillota bacterium]